MIRAAIVESGAQAALGAGGHGRSNGFVVSGQMTSLTGCAGEQFASILRSMGFRSVEMKRSQFVGSAPAPESPQESKPDSTARIPEGPTGGLALPPTGGEEGTPVDVPSASPEAPPVDASALDIAQPDVPIDECWSDASRTDSGAATGTPPILDTNSEDERKSEMIVVWRPDRSAFSRDKMRRDRDPVPSDQHSPNPPIGRQDNPGRSPAAAAGRKRSRSRREQPPSSLANHAARKAAMPPDRREAVRFDEKHRQTSSDRDMPRSLPASERQPRATVDPNSPFAKLLELRSLLEEQSNKRP